MLIYDKIKEYEVENAIGVSPIAYVVLGLNR